MPNVVCVVAANLVDERGYELGVARGEVEAILGVKQRAGFATDCTVRAKELRSERS